MVQVRFHSRDGRSLPIIALISCLHICEIRSEAFQQAVPGIDNKFAAQPRREGEGLIPPSDPDAESWLKRAADAATDGQWKLAADTLERVVDQYGDKTVSPDGKSFFSASDYAQQLISEWPDEGLKTYRLLYDPQVKLLMDRARGNFKLDGLREIVRKYRHSTYGP